ncbi:MAG: AraC family ligand binding domain-containing protein [Turneriella sp.]|nr:AraC family ligand binding domain-containing protein [Turneriella sp.]
MTRPYYDIQDSRRIFGSEVELMKFLKNLLLRDYKIYEMQYEQGTLVPYHAHSFAETMLVLEGMVRMIIEEDIVDVYPGQIVTIQPFAIHLAAFPREGGARFYLLYSEKDKNSIFPPVT